MSKSKVTSNGPLDIYMMGLLAVLATFATLFIIGFGILQAYEAIKPEPTECPRVQVYYTADKMRTTYYTGWTPSDEADKR